MLSYVEGEVLALGSNYVLLKVGGLGYRVVLPASVLFSLAPGKKAEFFTYQQVREDGQELFGFRRFEELELAEKLLTVSGIGPKTAQMMVGLGVEKVKAAIRSGDVSLFLTISGIGKKRAQQVVLDLKGTIDLTKLDASAKTDDVVLALEGLGYNLKEIMEVMRGVPAEAKTEDRLRLALQKLGN